MPAGAVRGRAFCDYWPIFRPGSPAAYSIGVIGARIGTFAEAFHFPSGSTVRPVVEVNIMALAVYQAAAAEITNSQPAIRSIVTLPAHRPAAKTPHPPARVLRTVNRPRLSVSEAKAAIPVRAHSGTNHIA